MMQGWTCESHLWIILIGQSDIVEVIRFVNLFQWTFHTGSHTLIVGDSCKLGDSGISEKFGDFGEFGGSCDSGASGDSGGGGYSGD